MWQTMDPYPRPRWGGFCPEKIAFIQILKLLIRLVDIWSYLKTKVKKLKYYEYLNMMGIFF